ncbi:MAG TPA: radical SAM family heme chaperone HemW [Tepidisphaeraceae bacterium]|jgi:oxygen-independent coproporphyrinogen-3 oxidase
MSSATSRLALAPTRLDLRSADLPAVPIEGLYVHIPFCFHKCHYCDFYSITRQTPQRMEAFVDLLLAEADLWAKRNAQPRTVFFGGGTPSLLPIDAMRRLIVGLRARFDFSRFDEWTIEINPATADFDYCKMLRELGVDRLSFGAQSFDRDELKTLERHHDPEDVARSVDLAQAAGFERLNLDLIYAIPGQSTESWRRSLEAALALGVSHLSCYGLTYETNTVIHVKRRLGHLIAADDDTELSMFADARHTLAAQGLEWYEISNYARPGEECRHNLVYWSGGNYIGLGPSAASHVGGHRFKNQPHLGEWERAVPNGSLPVVEHEILSQEQRIEERIMLALRLRRGVRFAELSDIAQTPPAVTYAVPLAHLAKLGLITLNDQGFALTETGLNVADGVAAELAKA